MKVTMIAREYPPYVYGGAGVHLKFLARELARLMDVEVRCFGDQDARDGRLRVKGYTFRKAGVHTDVRAAAGAAAPPPVVPDPLFAAALETFATDLAIVRDPLTTDVVHTHTWYAHYAGFLARMLYGVPFVAVSHSLEPLRPWKRDQLGTGYELSTWAEKTGLEGADRVIAVSGLMKADILQHFRVPEEKVVVIHNGVDPEKWVRTPLAPALAKQWGIKENYILFVGRPTPQKGLEHLVAARDLIPEEIQIVICAVGADTKEYEDRLTREVEQKPNMVWVHKLLQEEEYIQIYSGARVFVCPSIYEPFGIINLEAMACRTPVVASAVGGIKEVVLPGQTGLLVEPAQPQQLADAVNELLKDPERARQFGEAGRQRVEERFAWSQIARQTKALYETLVGKKP